MTTLDSAPTSSAPQEDPRYRFVYDEAVRLIDHQEETLDNLRSRAGLLLAATSVATSFLGAAALRDDQSAGWWGGIAIALFAVVGVLLVGLLLPLPNWKFRFGVSQLLTDYVEGTSPAQLNEMYRELALHLESNHVENNGRLKWMWLVFQLAALMLCFEVIAWLLALT